MKELNEFLEKLNGPEAPAGNALEVLSGPLDGRLFPLKPGTSTIGSRNPAEIVLDLDRSVAPVHAVLSHQDGRWFVENLGSSHSTCVNGESVGTKTAVGDGDHLLIGSTLLLLHLATT